MKNKQKTKKGVLVSICGIVIGFINGFLGGGGGMICVPLLEKICKYKNKQAHATTLCVILPLSIASAFVYINKNTINFLDLCFISVGAIAGAILGAFFLKKMNSKLVRIIFAILMAAAGIKMVI